MTAGRLLIPSLPSARVLLALAFALFPLLNGPAAVAGPVPVAPVEESEEEGNPTEVRTVAEWVAPARGDRRHPRPPAALAGDLPAAPPRPPAGALPRAAAADPFRNGLGTPFRC